MKIYFAIPADGDDDTAKVYVGRDRCVARELKAPVMQTGSDPVPFEWGLATVGAAELALAILTDHFGDERPAYLYHQPFMTAVIAKQEWGEAWIMSAREINMAISEIQRRVPAHAADRKNGHKVGLTNDKDNQVV